VNVWLTFDYELFFGARTGSIEKCMLEPTSRLLELAKRFRVPMTFFVDAGFLWKLNSLSSQFPELQEQHDKIASQLRDIIEQGGDIQLHVHPHWELTSYANGQWQIPQDKGYRLAEFSKQEAEDIFVKYKNHLDAVLGRKTIAYRAGGWCIQPFEQILDVFESSGLMYDSSVVPGMRFQAGVYDVDFSEVPKNKGVWSFHSDPCTIDENGKFIELPISSVKYNPLFYWELYLRGKMNKARHQFVGDGSFIPQPGRKWETLTKSQWNHASCDGFYASRMAKITREFQKSGREHLVFIGHPKGMTEFSFGALENYLEKHQNKLSFQTFTKFHAALR
jgi:peptidoglycan/xylan/chitin deacetylase (PgdA/CDA1 family)